MAALSSEHWQRVRTLLEQALDLSAEERRAFLDEACDGEADLRAEVDALLDAEAAAGSFLDEDVRGFAGALVEEAEQAQTPAMTGRQIGPYRLLKKLGRGGMGAVYLAKREDFKKLVALKLIRQDMDSEEVLQRFRNERQILAALDHPNIARLLDGGRTEEGLPYFVMEYVEGVAIDRYCDRHRLSIAERLALFQTVCGAVQFAHQNLVVHRDLKPSNILVTEAGEVKLLDFGIAKVLNPQMASAQMAVTRTEFRMLTPEYASPEQVMGESITTASDIYSLGVLLYELLTGHQPYRLKTRLHHELARVILEEEPTRPSTVVTEEAEVVRGDGTTARITPALVSGARNTQAERLRRRLQGDLDNIVLKALRKEPKRRYGTAAELGEDLRRHLAGLPVLARSATMGYRVRKFVRRHRWGVAGAALVTASLLVGLGVAVWQAGVAAQERDAARQEAAKLAEVTKFIVRVFEVADPGESLGETITARALLDRGLERIESELADVPEVQAAMMDVMGQVYQSLGLQASANPLIEQALAERQVLFKGDHPDVAASLHHVATVRLGEHTFDEADSLYRAALAMRQRLFKGDHPDVAASLQGLGLALRYQGALPEAEQRLREALAMRRRLYGNNHQDVATTLHVLGQFMHDKPGEDGVDYDEEAEKLYREALAIRRKVLDEKHPDLSLSLNDLAFILNQRGKFEEAEPLYREGIAIVRNVYGSEHARVASAVNNFGMMLWTSGAYEEAEPLFREALAINRKLKGDDASVVGMNLSNLGSLLRDLGQFEEADSLLRQSLALRRKILGEDHMLVGWVMNNLGLLNHYRGRDAQAESMLRAALAKIEQFYKRPSATIAVTQVNLARVLRRQGRLDEAETLLRESLETQLGAWGPAHHYVAEGRYQLAMVLLANGDVAAASAHADTALATLRDLYPEGHIKTSHALIALGKARLQQGRVEEAAVLLEDALALRQRLLPEGHWEIALAQRHLGACRLAQGRRGEARALFQTSYATLKEQLGDQHPETQAVRVHLSAL